MTKISAASLVSALAAATKVPTGEAGDKAASAEQLGVPFTNSVAIAAGALTLNFGSLAQRSFKGGSAIGQNTTWTFSNTTNALRFTFMFQVIGGLYTQTMPATVRMSDARYDFTTKVWTPADEGQYIAQGIWDGTVWLVTISGPYQLT